MWVTTCPARSGGTRAAPAQQSGISEENCGHRAGRLGKDTPGGRGAADDRPGTGERGPQAHVVGGDTNHRCVEHSTRSGWEGERALPSTSNLTDRGSPAGQPARLSPVNALGWGRRAGQTPGRCRVSREGEDGWEKPQQCRDEHFDAKTNDVFPYKPINSQIK